MSEYEMEKLLSGLTDATVEPARPDLAEDIKSQIPHQLSTHRHWTNTTSIIIDLRVSKFTAAAVIIITMFLLANFFGAADRGIFEAIKYSIVGEKASQSEILASLAGLHEGLVDQGKEVIYYGDSVNFKDRNAMLMHWKLPNGRYRVVFSDLRIMTLSPDVVIMLQAQMLKNKTQK